MSVFAIVKYRGRILLVKPQEHERWVQEWAPNWLIYQQEQLESEHTKWRFPSSYIREGEAPSDTLYRIMNDQLGIQKFRVKSQSFRNFYSESRRYPGRMHWDYCFIFDIVTSAKARKRPWFSELEFVEAKTTLASDFGSAQGDLALELGIAKH